jgi:transcriptional regulator with XRE-family HTH domain
LCPFCHLRLTAALPKPEGYPETLRTVGDYLKRRRLDLGLSLEKAGAQLGVDASALKGWEDGRFGVRPRHREKVIAFLSYNPFPPERPWAKEIREARLARGLTRKGLARILSVNQETVAAWERGTPPRRHLAQVERFLETKGAPAHSDEQAI